MEAQLRTYFSRYVALDDTEFNTLFTSLEYEKYRRKDHLLNQGEVCRFNYFILKGLVRTYYFDSEGKDKITRFAVENWWVTHTESFANETPSRLFIQAIEDTEVLRISRENLEALYVAVPKLERAFRIITQNMLIALQKRNDFFSQLNSKDRYLNFVENLPGFAQRIPQYMIASYLDMSPEYLSTIRKL